MNNPNKALFGSLLTSVAELYGKPLSAAMLEIYWQALERYSLEQVRRAVNLHVINPDNGQFMPKPADIVRYIDASNSVKALQAWDKALNAMRTIGAYHSIAFEDSLITLVISEMGGWSSLCLTKDDKLPFIAQEFQRRYTAHLLHPVSRPSQYLMGIIEHQNRLAGFEQHIPQPILFSPKENTRRLENFNPLKKLEKQDD